MRDSSKLLALVCWLTGACTSHGTVDGEINYDHYANPDAPHESIAVLQPDGQLHRKRTGTVPEVDETVTLSMDVVSDVYRKATDAGFEDLPPEILCNCSDDVIGGVRYTISVTIGGTIYKTVTHQTKTTPGALTELINTLEALTKPE